MEEPISGQISGLRSAFHREERGEQVRKSSRPGCTWHQSGLVLVKENIITIATVISSCPSGDGVVVHEDEGDEE